MKGGTDRQTDRGKLQLYIVDNLHKLCNRTNTHYRGDRALRTNSFAYDYLTFRLPQSDVADHFYFKIGSNPPCNIDILISYAIKATFATLKYLCYKTVSYFIFIRDSYDFVNQNL